MRSYKRYTRRKRLLKQIAVVALVFILGFVLLRAVSYMAIQGEIPMINSFNLFRREADTSFGWNLILVNDDYCVPRNYETEKKWIRESILSFSRCLMMPELRDLNYL